MAWQTAAYDPAMEDFQKFNNSTVFYKKIPNKGHTTDAIMA